MTDTEIHTNASSYYILDREYFSECFDESSNTTTSLKTYRQAILLIIMAGVFFILELESYVAWFLIGLGGLELLSIRYKRSWWITRQMFSRAAGSKVNVRIDDQGIFTDSTYHQQSILWNDMTNIKSTEKGFVITHQRGTSYLSKRGLEQNLLDLITEKSMVQV